MEYNFEKRYSAEKSYSNSIPTNFRDIIDPNHLIQYLRDDTRRLHNSKYIYHYTTLSTLIKIVRDKRWHLANAKDMNDRLEYESGDREKWPNIFFSSFMTEDKESIGMWSMYAQPWETGVKIAIPSRIVRSWIHGTKEIEEIANYAPSGRKVQLDHGQITLASVAYSNIGREKSVEEKICWSTVTNTNFKEPARIEEFTGYIKDVAWSYEKEIRIRLELNNLNNKEGFDRVSIGLTDEVINAMTITPSPLFQGDLYTELKKETGRQLEVEYSLFKDKLNIRTSCQSCKFKQKVPPPRLA